MPFEPSTQEADYKPPGNGKKQVKLRYTLAAIPQSAMY
jgi:hypothetical protein